MSWPNGEKYEGTFFSFDVDNWGFDFGTFYYSDGRIFKGSYTHTSNNSFNEGTMTYPNKEVYQGSFRDNQFHGYGKLTLADDQILEG